MVNSMLFNNPLVLQYYENYEYYWGPERWLMGNDSKTEVLNSLSLGPTWQKEKTNFLELYFGEQFSC